MKKILITEPMGGLANRMNVIRHSVLFCAEHTEYRLVVLWNVNNEIGCKFDDIFENSTYKVVNIRYRWITKERKKKLSLVFVKIIGYLIYIILHAIIKINEASFDVIDMNASLVVNSFQADEIFLSKKFWVYYHDWKWFKPMDYSMFRFNKEYYEVVDKTLGNNKDIIGVHIRRIEHPDVINRNPLNIFIEAMDVEYAATPDVKFYISTDDMQLLSELELRYGNNIIKQENTRRERNSIDGMRSAIIDIIALSKCKKIYGSNGSTFSYVAAYLENTQLLFYIKEKNMWVDYTELYDI